jgi:hypothetical protein
VGQFNFDAGASLSPSRVAELALVRARRVPVFLPAQTLDSGFLARMSQSTCSQLVALRFVDARAGMTGTGSDYEHRSK